MPQLDVVIPAGGRLDDQFARVVATPSKALIRFDGKTVLESTIEALRVRGHAVEAVAPAGFAPGGLNPRLLRSEPTPERTRAR